MDIYWTFWGAAGLVFGLGGAAHLARRTARSPGLVLASAPLVAVGLAFAGARLHAMMSAPGDVWRSVVSGTFLQLAASSGQRIAGGLLLATAFLLFVVPRASGRLGGLAVLDTLVPWAGLSIAIGRFGCFFAGCCFGQPSDLPWAVVHPYGSPAYWNHVAQAFIADTVRASLPVHPFPLYLGGAAGLAALVAALVARRARAPGQGTASFVMAMTASRLALEPLRETTFLGRVPGQTEIDVLLLAIATGGALYLRSSNGAGPSRPGTPMRWMRRAVSPSRSSYRGRLPSSRQTR